MKALGYLFLLLLAVGGVGFVLDWWSFSSETQAGETEYSLTVDKDKIGADTKAATDKIKETTQELVDKVKRAGGKAETGTVLAVGVTSLEIELEDGSNATFDLDTGTRIEVGDAAASIGDLKTGRVVTVFDEDADGTAERIVVAPK